MKKKKVKYFVAITLLLALTALISIFFYKRSTTYVMNVLAPPHEAAGEAFFQENREDLVSLTECIIEIDEGDIYNYTFHVHVFDTPNMPTEIETILKRIEAKEEDTYSFQITKHRASVLIGNETRLEVWISYTDYGVEFEMESDEVNIIDLGDGWNLYSTYVIRG